MNIPLRKWVAGIAAAGAWLAIAVVLLFNGWTLAFSTVAFSTALIELWVVRRMIAEGRRLDAEIEASLRAVVTGEVER